MIIALLGTLFSLFLLSVLSNILTGYPAPSQQGESREEPSGSDTVDETPILLFKVSPAAPRLYWRVLTADYYTGRNWLRTTNEKALEGDPQVQDANATEVFSVEINTSKRETLLPFPPPISSLTSLSLAPAEDLEFYFDEVGGVYMIMKDQQVESIQLTYDVSWRDVELDDRRISLSDISEEILDKYLQLPDLPIEVWELAQDLKVPSYSALDQVLANVQFLRTNFVYSLDRSRTDFIHDPTYSQLLFKRISQESDVSSFIERKKGICLDAATALVVILRMQKIPARISVGYKPGRIEGGELLYYTSGSHAMTEVYLPPYGWIQFDATPPLEKCPLVKVAPFKRESSPGSKLFYQLSVTNRRNITDNFKLFVTNKLKWNFEVAPVELSIDALQAADVLLEVNAPEHVEVGEKNLLTVTVTSMSDPESAFSIWAIAQVGDVLQIPTTIALRNLEDPLIRGDTFWVNGTILAVGNEMVDNMTVFIFVTKGRKAEGIIIGKGYSERGVFQVKSTIPSFMEVGDYKVVPVSLRTTQYAPSHNEFIIRLCATTTMQISSEDEFLLGYGAIYGRLAWDNGTGFAEAPISHEVASLTTRPEIWVSQNLTLRDGSFRIEPKVEDPGAYKIETVFSGNEYALESNATRLIEFTIGLPSIQILSENTAVRGEVFNVTGRVRFEDVEVWGEPITIAFDNRLLTTTETRSNGSFTYSFPLDPEERLGTHDYTVTLERRDVSTLNHVLVKSKTALNTTVSDVGGGIFHLLSVSLTDDHNLPVRETEIVIDNYGLSCETDENGTLALLLDVVRLWPENLLIAARFEGSELYLPATIDKRVGLEPAISLPFLIPLVTPILAVVAVIYAKHSVESGQTSEEVRVLGVGEERTGVEQELIHKPQRIQPLKIVLPDIGVQFPSVWGINEKLRAEIALDNAFSQRIQRRDVEVFVDEDPFTFARLSQQGRTQLSLVFKEEGEHTVRATLPRMSGAQSWNAKIKLRVVDYEVEIIRLYNEFLKTLASFSIDARSDMTAREIESIVLKTRDVSPEALRNVTKCFEKAEYSNHMVTRKDYEIMYLSLKESEVDVE